MIIMREIEEFDNGRIDARIGRIGTVKLLLLTLSLVNLHALSALDFALVVATTHQLFPRMCVPPKRLVVHRALR